MPEHTLTVNAELQRLLERVRVRRGMANLEQALEWLVKTRIRRISRQAGGNVLYLVSERDGTA
ncbi:hypothetical protein [uncultured Xylophilus sp.]|uniref:hypothetical protein n=1 Tax=uncultured Xylophilus sp. TaxID=296832 RepID=UPI0025F5B37D|nr:hypothetical protein [uncultured Xylophilus sp.]